MLRAFNNTKKACHDFKEIKCYLRSTEEYKEFSAAKKALKAAVRQDLVKGCSYDQIFEKIKVENVMPLQEETNKKIGGITLKND